MIQAASGKSLTSIYKIGIELVINVAGTLIIINCDLFITLADVHVMTCCPSGC